MNGDVEIIKATENELNAVVELVYSSLLYHQPLDPFLVVTDETKAQIEKESLRRISNPQFMVFLAKNEEGFCGLISGVISSFGLINPGKKVLRVEDLFVKEERRRGGVAKRLFETCSAYAKDIGIDTVTLSVLSNNEKAVGFYKSVGFEISAYKMIKQL